MWRTLGLLAPVASLVGGCAHTSADVTYAAEPPEREPGGTVDMVPSPPEHAVLIGHIEVRRGVFASEEDCEDRIRHEARGMGATHAVVLRHHHFTPHAASYHVENETFDGCYGEAYYLVEERDEGRSRSMWHMGIRRRGAALAVRRGLQGRR